MKNFPKTRTIIYWLKSTSSNLSWIRFNIYLANRLMSNAWVWNRSEKMWFVWFHSIPISMHTFWLLCMMMARTFATARTFWQIYFDIHQKMIAVNIEQNRPNPTHTITTTDISTVERVYILLISCTRVLFMYLFQNVRKQIALKIELTRIDNNTILPKHKSLLGQ